MKSGDDALVQKMSNFVEKMSSSDDEKIQELVAYGFLENFDITNAAIEKVVDSFGEDTKKLLGEVNEFWNDYEKTIEGQS